MGSDAALSRHPLIRAVHQLENSVGGEVSSGQFCRFSPLGRLGPAGYGRFEQNVHARDNRCFDECVRDLV